MEREENRIAEAILKKNKVEYYAAVKKKRDLSMQCKSTLAWQISYAPPCFLALCFC
jgi:hypothetical protein